MRPYKLPECLPMDVLQDGIEWVEPPLGKNAILKMKRRAARVAAIIAWDFQRWQEAERKRSAGLAKVIAKDKEDQRQRDALESARLDMVDSCETAHRMVEKLAPAIHKAIEAECKELRREIARDRDKIFRHGRKVAHDKFARFKRRKR